MAAGSTPPHPAAPRLSSMHVYRTAGERLELLGLSPATPSLVPCNVVHARGCPGRGLPGGLPQAVLGRTRWAPGVDKFLVGGNAEHEARGSLPGLASPAELLAPRPAPPRHTGQIVDRVVHEKLRAPCPSVCLPVPPLLCAQCLSRPGQPAPATPCSPVPSRKFHFKVGSDRNRTAATTHKRPTELMTET